jgi:hypothetical protein
MFEPEVFFNCTPCAKPPAFVLFDPTDPNALSELTPIPKLYPPPVLLDPVPTK